MMFKKDTHELMNERSNSNNIDDFFSNNKSELSQCNNREEIKIKFQQFLISLIDNSHVSKSTVIKNSNIDRVYGYEILNGKKIPARDKVIAIAFSLHLDLQTTQRLLKTAYHRELYPRDKRDAVIIHANQKSLNLLNLNSLLFEKGFKIVE